MRSSGSLLTSNALIQRVRRHRTMATLYRSAGEDVAAEPLPPAPSVSAADRVPIPKASLLPTSSVLPEGRVFSISEGTLPVTQSSHRPVAPPPATTSVQPQRIQRQEKASGPGPAAPERAAPRPTPTQLPGKAEEQPSQDEGFDWISDKEWDSLKSFMEGHQEKLAREGTKEKSDKVQRSPQEEAQQEAHQQAQAELARRQELARSGRLPRAKVEYVSEKRTPSPDSPQTTGEGAQRSPQETVDVQPEGQVGETTQIEGPREESIDRSQSQTEVVQPTAEDQKPDPPAGQIQRQVEETTKKQEGPVDSEEADRSPSEGKLAEGSTGEAADELPPSGSLELGSELAGETPVREGEQDVGERPGLAKTESSPIQREARGKPTEGKPAESQPANEVDRQEASESTPSPSEPPEDQESPGIGRRLLEAARSFFGREDSVPESDRPAEELPTRPPDEPHTSVQEEKTAAVGDKILQRQPVEEDQDDTLPEMEEEESGPSPDTFQPQESLKGKDGLEKDTSPETSKEIPTQIQRDDRITARETEKQQMAAEEESQAETGPSSPGEVIARQEQGSPPEKPAKVEPDSGLPQDISEPEQQEMADQASGRSVTQTDSIEDETFMQAADQVLDAETGVKDTQERPLSQEPDEGTSRKEEDIADFEVLETADDQTTTQALPLQKAWPVQELHPPRDLPPSMTRPAETTKPGVTAQRKPAGDDGFADEVHQATKDVSPSKPTDSSIELVTPRRPRPTEPPGSKPAPDIRRKSPESRQPDLTKPEPAGESDTISPERQPYLVPTEIGDLPSDFWQMLGEKPPKPQEKGPTAKAQVEPTTAAPAVQQMPETNGAPAQVAEMPSPLVTQEFPDPFVQRAISIRDIETITDREPEETETGGEPEIDIDQLAREVFPEIKRRLKVEWERGRGRF